MAVGVGGILLGGAGGFLIGGKSGGGSGDNSRDLADSKSGRARVVAVESSRSESASSLEEIYREPSQTARVRKLQDFYANLTPEQFEAEASKLDDLPFSERILASFLLFSQWAEVDATGALAFTNTMGRAGFFVKPTVLQSWASTDPSAAAQYLEDNPRDFATIGMMGGGRGRGQGGAAGTIATEWARQDPSAALAWAKGLDGRDGSAAVSNVIKQVASEDPAEALDIANGLDDESARDAAYASIALEWGREDWGAMESWANGLPADQRDSVLAQGVQGLAQNNPEEAAAKLLTISEGDARDGAFEEVIEGWAQQNPTEAMNFLLENGSESAQRDAMREAMGPLARTDPDSALTIINGMEDNSIRDRAVSSFVFNSPNIEPAEVINLAATIGDEGTRSRSVGVAAGQWLLEDEEAANTFFETSDIIEADTLESIRNRVNGGGGGRGFGGGRRR